MVERKTLIAYAAHFASFLLDSPVGGKIDKIILFGSVATGEFDAESDIDVFIEAPPQLEQQVVKLTNLFEASDLAKRWRLKGVANPLSPKIGRLTEWKLRREVISSGIILYGKYSALPEKARYLALIRPDLSRIRPYSRRVAIWRQLYGYKQKVGKKAYITKGMIEAVGGRKLAPGIFIVPIEKAGEIERALNRRHVSYTIDELWSDTL